MKKRRLLKSYQSRRTVLCVGLFLAWLALVICLPEAGICIVGAIGIAYGLNKYWKWGNDPTGFSKWGCFLQMKMTALEFRVDTERSWTAEQEAQLAALIEKQTLLRATEMENAPEQELLRPATETGEQNSGELLRSGDKPADSQ